MFLDLVKAVVMVLGIMILVVIGLLAAPTIWAKMNEDKPIYPHSGFTPECSTWDAPIDEELLHRR